MNLNTLKDKLIKHNFTIAVSTSNGEIYTSYLKGIAPFLNKLLENENYFNDAILADKVVGKAAAMLFVKGKIKQVYALTISKKAMLILNKYHIAYEYENQCDYIKNRMKTGMCPMEESIDNLDDIETAYQILIKKVDELKNKGGLQ